MKHGIDGFGEFGEVAFINTAGIAPDIPDIILFGLQSASYDF